MLGALSAFIYIVWLVPEPWKWWLAKLYLLSFLIVA